jgi:predicted phosphate transport protein (TIGR00153 family)
MRLRLMPRERVFYELFNEDIGNTMAGAVALADMLRRFENVKAKAAAITEIELEGDRITHEIFRKLNATFVTPIEREDIIALASILDSVVDLIEETAIMLVLYNVKAPSVFLLEASTLLVASVEQLQFAVHGLERLKGLKPFIVEVNRIENEADGLYRNAISELFSQGLYDPLEVIKLYRLYDLMEKAFDKCEDVANVIENLVMKNA